MAIKIEKSNKTVKESFSDDIIDNATKELTNLEDTSDTDKSIVSVVRPADKAALDSHKRNLTIERDRLKKAYKDPAAKSLNDAHDLQMKEIHDLIKKGGDIIPLSGKHSSTSKAIQEAERFGYSAKGTKKKWKIEAYTGKEKGYRKQLHLYTLDESAKKEIVYTYQVVLADDYSEVLYSVEVPSSEFSEDRDKEALAEVMEWAEERERNKQEGDLPIEVITGYYSWDDEDKTTLLDPEVVWTNDTSKNESISNKRKKTHIKVYEGLKHFGDKSNLNEEFEVVTAICSPEDFVDYFSNYDTDTLEDVVYHYLDYLYSNDRLETLYNELDKRAEDLSLLEHDKLIDLIYDVAEELFDETPERYEETDGEEPEEVEDEYDEEEVFDEGYITTPQKKHIANTEKADLNTYVPEESVKSFWEEIKSKGKEDDLLFVLESSFGDNPTVDNLTELLTNEEFTRDLLDLNEEVEEEYHPDNFDDIELAREPEVVETKPTFYFDIDGNILEETEEEEESK